VTEAEDAGARWIRLMRRGAWEEAWRLSDAAMAMRGGVVDWRAPRHLQHIWTGGPLEGRRVLVRCYHGLGDTVQFIRYAPLLDARCAALTVWAQPALIPLLGTMPAAGTLMPLHDGAPEAEYDLDIEVMELPHLFRSTPATLPARVPYLHPPRRTLPRGTLHVGLVWAAGDWDTRRSVPAALLPPLAQIPGVTFHLLQRGAARADWPGAGDGSGSDDALDTASLMTALDLVVSVDSFPAHLAGALGRPVWTLLHADADWRWMAGRDDSPWYPTMRLFRQARAGEWEPVVSRVAERLRALAARHAA
jgi:hypothetical protein